MASTFMSRPTFLQKVLRRPSKKYASTTEPTTEPTFHRTKDFHSTKEELLRIAAELNREGRTSGAPCHHNQEDEKTIAHGSIRYDPPTVGAELDICVDNLQMSDDIFYTPDSSPVSSSPAASRSHTPVHSPYPTPPDSASSSRASLGSAHLQDASVSTTSLPQSSTGAAIAMIPVINESKRHKRISNDRKLTYTDEDWAKDVRWLVPPSQSGASGKHKSKTSRRNTAPSDASNAASRSSSSLPSSISLRSTTKPYPFEVSKTDHLSPHGRKHGHMKPKGTRAVVGMTVLLEVEEDIDSPESGFSGKPSTLNRNISHKRSQSLSHAPTHVLESPKPSRPSQRAPNLVRRRSSSFPSPFHISTPSRPSSTRSHSRANNVAPQATTSSVVTASGIQPSRATASSSHVTSSSMKSPYTSAPLNMVDGLAAYSSSSHDVDALPSIATRGFTGLVLPRAATAASGSMSTVAPKRHFKGRRGSTTTEMLGAGLGLGDEIDLTQAGLAQTTMASVEIVRGIASDAVQRKESKSRRPLFGLGWLSKNSDKEKGKARQEDVETPLGFTAYRTPPVYVGGSSVLVQVWAVGLDGVDAQLVGLHPQSTKEPLPGTTPELKEGRSTAKDKKRHVPVGYIPGRSFVGRVLEVGWEVGEDTIKKGEWVIGLNSVLKCGALAEFILVDRHHIHRAPHPYIPNHPTLALASLNEDDEDNNRGRRNSLVFPSADEPKGLTVDELALLPLSGVSAYRTVRTLTHITRAFKLAKPDIAARETTRHSYDVSSDTDENDVVAIVHPIRPSLADKQLDAARPRVLILRGHDGPGALALQMLVRAGWSVWTHVPVPFDLPGPPRGSECDSRDEDEDRTLGRRRVALERIEKRLREWGADGVLFVPIESSPPPTSFLSSPAPNASPIPFTSRSPSSSPSPSASPSPFSRSSTSSPLSSPSLTPLDPTSHSDISSTHGITLPPPYSYTALPLAPYKTEAASVTALLTYLTRGRVRFEAVIDTVGGREIWEAGRALLSLPVGDATIRHIDGQFTTLVGDAPDRVMSTASDHFYAGVRALRIGKAKGAPQEDPAASQSIVSPSGKKNKKLKPRPVNYAWVNVVSEVDWEGADVHDSLGAVLAMAVEQGVRPAAGLANFPNALQGGKGKMKAVFMGGDGETSGKVVSFENTPHIFVPRGGLEHGGTVVSRIAE